MMETISCWGLPTTTSVRAAIAVDFTNSWRTAMNSADGAWAHACV